MSKLFMNNLMFFTTLTLFDDFKIETNKKNIDVIIRKNTSYQQLSAKMSIEIIR